GAAGAGTADDGVLEVLDGTVQGLFARLQQGHLRDGHEEIDDMVRHGEEEADLLPLATREEGAVAAVGEDAEMHADRLEGEAERDSLGLEQAEPLLGLRSAVLRGVFDEIGSGLRLLRLDEQL